MKKLISVLCVLAMIVGILAVTAVSGAAEVSSAQTTVNVKEGDEVTYTLTLGGVAEPVIGCDFSMYYDSALLECTSVEDFTGTSDWSAVINPDLDGEVRGNWSILRGVDFSKDRQFLSVTLKAKKSGESHLSYFIRYMYDNNIFESDDKPQITVYKFTCDVLVNGEPVIEKAPPELNVGETQTTGLFVNSVTGDSKDADSDLPGTVVNKPATGHVNDKTNNANVDNNNDGNKGGGANNNNNAADDTDAKTPLATTAEGNYVPATDAEGNVIPAVDGNSAVAGDNSVSSSPSPILWIIIVLLVLAGGGAAVYFFMKKKPGDSASDIEKP